MLRRSKKKLPTDEDLTLRDKLAIDRTKLANTRTLLAFFRTSLYLLVTALAVMKVDFLKGLSEYAWIFVVISGLVMSAGLVNFFLVKSRVKKLYKF